MQIKDIIQGIPGQFMIGGLTVAGISYFGNSDINPILAGVVAAMPIGMPSSIFVKDSKVAQYSKNLLLMSIVLFAVTTTNWYFISILKWTKYKSVGASMALYFVGALIMGYVTHVHDKAKNK